MSPNLTNQTCPCSKTYLGKIHFIPLNFVGIDTLHVDLSILWHWALNLLKFVDLHHLPYFVVISDGKRSTCHPRDILWSTMPILSSIMCKLSKEGTLQFRLHLQFLLASFMHFSSTVPRDLRRYQLIPVASFSIDFIS